MGWVGGGALWVRGFFGFGWFWLVGWGRRGEGRLASEEHGKSGEGEGDEVAVDAKGPVEAVAHGGLGGQSGETVLRTGGVETMRPASC